MVGSTPTRVVDAGLGELSHPGSTLAAVGWTLALLGTLLVLSLGSFVAASNAGHDGYPERRRQWNWIGVGLLIAVPIVFLVLAQLIQLPPD